MEEQVKMGEAEKKSSVGKTKKKKTTSIFFKVDKKGRHISPCLSFLRIYILPVVRLFYPFKIVGQKKVPDGPCVFVSNHYRMIDPMYMLPTTKEGIHFIAKKESADIPIFGFFIKKVKTIFVNRDGTDVRAIIDAQKCLKNGEKIAIYPEGKRNKTDARFLPFNSGSAMLAIRAKAPIVPVVITKKTRFLRKNHVLIGQPFELSEYYDVKLTEELLKQADDKILARMVTMLDEHEKSFAVKGK